MEKLFIELPELTVKKLEKIAILEDQTVKSWIERVVKRRVDDKPIVGEKPNPASWQPNRISLVSAAMELNRVLKLEQRLSNNWRNPMIIEKLKEAAKNIDWEMDYITENTINTLKDIKAIWK